MNGHSRSLSGRGDDWTEEEDAALARAIGPRGPYGAQIAAATGRSEDAAHGRASRLGLTRAHRGEGHPDAVLDESDVVFIRAAHASGESSAALARRFGVARGTIRALLLGKTWKHVPRPEGGGCDAQSPRGTG